MNNYCAEITAAQGRVYALHKQIDASPRDVKLQPGDSSALRS